MKIALFICVLWIRTLQICDTRPWDYPTNKLDLLDQELELSVGRQLQLNSEEEEANDILMFYKNKELDVIFRDPKLFYFKNSFLRYKQAINDSKVYEIIKSMPKGGALHLHNSALLDADSLVELTYEEHAYVCIVERNLTINFSLTVPENNCAGDWKLLKDLRNNSSDVRKFDECLKKFFLLDFNELYDADIDTIWKNFEQVISNIQSLIRYRPVYEKYYYRVLKNFYNDKVKYMEIRGSFRSCYELDGTVRDSNYVIDMLNRIVEQFKKDHPSFISVKIILTRYRGNRVKESRRAIRQSLNLADEYPDIVVGFDLVGQEDKGKPLSDFTRVLKDFKNQLDFYFHAGETNWFGTAADDNIYDSLLLNTKRIGHAFSLVKHPLLMKIVKEKDIAIEVNVISNGMLGLLRDMRNHPAALYLADGMPVVISSDDPAVWGADPLSHDFFITFMAVASRRADLRMLKQLALNSIKYSALDDDTKYDFEKKFHKSWMKFIKHVKKHFVEMKTNDRNTTIC